jgi:hypothetical protein
VERVGVCGTDMEFFAGEMATFTRGTRPTRCVSGMSGRGRQRRKRSRFFMGWSQGSWATPSSATSPFAGAEGLSACLREPIACEAPRVAHESTVS